MARKRKHEEHVNHERWLVSYADFITLLFAFFVVMYAISSVNQGKYRVLSDSLVAAFRFTPKSMTPIETGDPDKAAPPRIPEHGIIPMPNAQPPRSLTPVNTQRAAGNQLPEEQIHPAAQDLPRIAEQIEQAMAPLVERRLVAVRRDDKQRWLEVEIKASILFGSGSAHLEREALPVLERLGAIMSRFANPIEVRGHTDNKPISSLVFPTNWELSAARAASVVRLLAESGVEPARLSAIGYGEYQPIADNDTEAGRSRNRRVSVLILADEAVRHSLQTSHPELLQPAPQHEADAGTAPETAPPATKNEASQPPVAVIPSTTAPPNVTVADLPEGLRREDDGAAASDVTPPDTAPVPELISPAPVQTGVTAASKPARRAPASPGIIQRKITPIAPPIQLAPPVQIRLLSMPQAGMEAQ